MLLLYSCANQVAPTGGPKDTAPPKVLKCFPENRSINFSTDKVSISFDEFIQLKNPESEIFISPALDKKPEIKAHGKMLSINFKSKLRANTTYTINFGESILDITE